MTDAGADTNLQTRRRKAVDDARAIVAFSGGSSDAAMEALNERYIAGELTSEEVIAEILRQVRSTSSAAQLEELTQLRAFRERYRAHAAALASVRLEGQELDGVSRAIAARWVEGELSDEEELAELDRHFGHPRARTQH